jgi:lycopene cyclase domain-containing protein
MADALLGWLPVQYYHLGLLVLAAAIFHGILWTRNGRFLWSQRRTILFVVLVGEVWNLITEPIGGWWRAWFFAPNRVLGVWLFQYMPIEDLLGAAVISSAAACAVLVFGYGPRKFV